MGLPLRRRAALCPGLALSRRVSQSTSFPSPDMSFALCALCVCVCDVSAINCCPSPFCATTQLATAHSVLLEGEDDAHTRRRINVIVLYSVHVFVLRKQRSPSTDLHMRANQLNRRDSRWGIECGSMSDCAPQGVTSGISTVGGEGRQPSLSAGGRGARAGGRHGPPPPLSGG